MLPSESWSPSSRPRLFLRDEIHPPMTGARKRLGSYPSSFTIDLISPFRSPGVVDREVARVPVERVDLPAQDPRAHGVEGADPGRARRPPPGTSRSTRSRISFAALLVKVIARISHGATPRFRIRFAMRVVTTRVFPEPGPATIRSGPSPFRAASRCCGFEPVGEGLVALLRRLGQRLLHVQPIHRGGESTRRASARWPRAARQLRSGSRMTMSRSSVISSTALAGPSRPRPESLTPPYGITSARQEGTSPTITAPTSSSSQARCARWRSRVNTPAWRPNRVLIRLHERPRRSRARGPGRPPVRRPPRPAPPPRRGRPRGAIAGTTAPSRSSRRQRGCVAPDGARTPPPTASTRDRVALRDQRARRSRPSCDGSP